MIEGKLYTCQRAIEEINKIAKKEFENNSNLTVKQNIDNEFSLLKIPKQSFYDSLDLKEGPNKLEYKFIGNLNSQKLLQCYLFYYPYVHQRRIVISDIDGTITKSDVLGHILTRFSIDWTHKGIAKLYKTIFDRGYIIIYISSRNCGLYDTTREYLDSIYQDETKLPCGPILLSPGTLFESIKREVIVGNPEVFKIDVLKNLNNIFSAKKSYIPLYAGMGNRDTDEKSYIAAGISKRRIFTIDDNSNILGHCKFTMVSYHQIHQNIEETFPKFDKDEVIIGNTHLTFFL